jgi:hypothetical protein
VNALKFYQPSFYESETYRALSSLLQVPDWSRRHKDT